MQGRCAICEREERLTRHHLVPRARHHNKRNKRDFAVRSYARWQVSVARVTPRFIQVLTAKQLERDFNTIAKLRAHPEIAKFARWIAARPNGFRAAMRSSKAVRTAR
jgi:hypothetical protein